MASPPANSSLFPTSSSYSSTSLWWTLHLGNRCPWFSIILWWKTHSSCSLSKSLFLYSLFFIALDFRNRISGNCFLYLFWTLHFELMVSGPFCAFLLPSNSAAWLVNFFTVLYWSWLNYIMTDLYNYTRSSAFVWLIGCI